MRPLKEKVSISLDKDMVEQLKELAEKTIDYFPNISTLCFVIILQINWIKNKLTKKSRSTNRIYSFSIYAHFFCI